VCLRAWGDALPARDGACGYVRRLIFALFSPVCSSFSPLHGGMVKTTF